jgi:lipoprotein-releasing system ATP-binding protein
MEDIILEAKNVHKSFEAAVLLGIDLKVKKGESVAIMGASGEGKTTLLHILGTLERASKGSVFINEEILRGKKNSKGLFNKNDFFRNNFLRSNFFGFIFQSNNLLNDMSLFENVSMPARISRKNREKFQKRVEGLIEEVSLLDKKNEIVKYLSGGEKKRVAIARAFCNDPEIILADEPTGNLDRKNSKVIHSLLMKFVKDKNKTLIVATHDEELANLCEKKFILKDGILHKG